VSNWTALAVASVIGFFLSPFVVQRLGDSGYGVWILMASLTGYLGLLDLGVRGAVTRYVARFHARSSHREASDVVSSALAIFCIVGVVVIALAFSLAEPIVSAFQIPQVHRVEAKFVLILAGLGVAVTLISGVFGGVVAGLQRFVWQNVVEIAAAVLRAILTVVVLLQGKGLVGLAVVHLCLTTLTGLAYAYASLRLYPGLRIRFSRLSLPKTRLILSFGAFSILLDLARYLILYTDSVVIGSFQPIASVTFFAIAANLVTYSRSLILGISTTLLPMASAIEAAGQRPELQQLLLKASRYATLVILPLAITFLLRGRSFIGLWMGASYGTPSGDVLWILSWALMFMASSQVGTSTMLGIGRHRALVPVAAGEALCNLALSIWLVRHWGIIGVAWGTTVPSMAISLIFWPWYVHAVLGVSMSDFVRSAWLRPALAMAPFAGMTAIVQHFWSAHDLLMFFLQVTLLLPIAVMGAWIFALEPPERRHFSERLLRPLLAWHLRA
jgi:O-antigen/teichoic acid export membrane protein